jgi:Lanthionine-containing peptide SapB precursor RamS
MALLDMQGLELKTRRGDEGCGGSDLSVALCDSAASVTLCL